MPLTPLTESSIIVSRRRAFFTIQLFCVHAACCRRSCPPRLCERNGRVTADAFVLLGCATMRGMGRCPAHVVQSKESEFARLRASLRVWRNTDSHPVSVCPVRCDGTRVPLWVDFRIICAPVWKEKRLCFHIFFIPVLIRTWMRPNPFRLDLISTHSRTFVPL